ncbi:low affinity iron permease family protein [Phyllobacterium sp. K27]
MSTPLTARHSTTLLKESSLSRAQIRKLTAFNNLNEPSWTCRHVPEQEFYQGSEQRCHSGRSSVTFMICVASVLGWAITGPIFGFSETCQLIVNTGTTIVTFLTVFFIRNTQNRDGAAIQAKLDEVIRASEAKNNFIGIERLTENEVEEFRKRCEKTAEEAAEEKQAT